MDVSSSQRSSEVNSGSQRAMNNTPIGSLTYCPVCQFPIKTLRIATPSKHISKCMKKKKKPQKECSNGVDCISTMESHYQLYSHKTLQEYREDPDRSPPPSCSSTKSIDVIFETLHGRNPKIELKQDPVKRKHDAPFPKPFVDLTDGTNSSEEFKSTQSSINSSKTSSKSFVKVKVSPLVNSSVANKIKSELPPVLGKHQTKTTDYFGKPEIKKPRTSSSENYEIFSSQKSVISSQNPHNLSKVINKPRTQASKPRGKLKKKNAIKAEPLGDNPWSITSSQIEKLRSPLKIISVKSDCKEVEIIDLTDEPIVDSTKSKSILNSRRSPCENSTPPPAERKIDAKEKNAPFINISSTSGVAKNDTESNTANFNPLLIKVKAKPLSQTQKGGGIKKFLSGKNGIHLKKFPVVRIERLSQSEISTEHQKVNPECVNDAPTSPKNRENCAFVKKSPIIVVGDGENDKNYPLQSTQIPNFKQKSQSNTATTLDTQDSEDWILPLPQGPGFVPVSPICVSKERSSSLLTPGCVENSSLLPPASSMDSECEDIFNGECSSISNELRSKNGKKASKISVDKNGNVLYKEMSDKCGNHVMETHTNESDNKTTVNGDFYTDIRTKENVTPNAENDHNFDKVLLESKKSATENVKNNLTKNSPMTLFNCAVEIDSGAETELDESFEVESNTVRQNAEEDVDSDSTLGYDNIMECSMLQGLSQAETLPILNPAFCGTKRTNDSCTNNKFNNNINDAREFPKTKSSNSEKLFNGEMSGNTNCTSNEPSKINKLNVHGRTNACERKQRDIQSTNQLNVPHKLKNVSFSDDIPSCSGLNNVKLTSAGISGGDISYSFNPKAASESMITTAPSKIKTVPVCVAQNMTPISETFPNGVKNVPETLDKAQNLENWLNSAKKKNKQGDIGSMMFGLKPKPAEKLEEKKKVNRFWNNGARPRNGFYGGMNKPRKCPFYKKVTGTDIAVDAFSYGVVEGVQFYFLSHFHADHYMGLTKKYWKHKVFCSQVTGNLVSQKIRLSEELIVRLPMWEEIVVGDVKVTLLEANHCPGAVLFLFKLRNNKVMLHTGDFRAQAEMEEYVALQGIKIDTLYLDTTYLNPEYQFPLQGDVINSAVAVATKAMEECPKTLFVVGTYLIGKERIFAAVAKAIKSKVFVAQEKFRTIQCLEDRQLSDLVTKNAVEANVHVVAMRQLTVKDLKTRLCQYRDYEQVVAFKPTGWAHDNKHPGLDRIKPVISGPVKIYALPYSEHSSFEDLRRFVKFLRPTRIIPTVNVGSKQSRDEMNKYLDKWKIGLDPT